MLKRRTTSLVCDPATPFWEALDPFAKDEIRGFFDSYWERLYSARNQ